MPAELGFRNTPESPKQVAKKYCTAAATAKAPAKRRRYRIKHGGRKRLSANEPAKFP